MGNCCGKKSSDNFANPGRTLGSASSAHQPSSDQVPSKIASTRRSLGGAPTGGDGTGDDPRAAAARAAEVTGIPGGGAS